MSQTSVQSHPQQTPQTSEPGAGSFHIPDGPPQPHPQEEIAQSQRSTTSKDSNKPVIGPDEELTDEKAHELGLPEQKHSGQIGYGPEYMNMYHVGLSDKVKGVKEEIVGKIKRDPELVTRGKERRTGELKRKERGEQDEPDAFTAPEEHAGKQSPEVSTPNQNQKQDRTPSTTNQDNTNNTNPSAVKFADGQKNSTNQPANIDSDRRQVQEQEQAGKTRDVDLKTGEGHLNPDAHKDKEVERAAQL